MDQYALNLFDNPPTDEPKAAAEPVPGSGPPPDKPSTQPQAIDAPATVPAPKAAPGTLATVVETVKSWPDLSPGRRRDLVSDTRSLARLLHRPPGLLPADLRQLRELVAGLEPAAAGISAKRLANILANVAAAIRLTGPAPAARRKPSPLLAEWQALADACPQANLRWEQSRWMRWCSERGIAPSAVSPALFEQFLHDVAASSLAVDPDRLRRQTETAWASCRAEVPGWPQIDLAPPRVSWRWTRAWSDFTPALNADVDQWISLLAGTDLLDPRTPPRPLRPATLATRRQQIRTCASALLDAGVSISAINGLADIANPDAMLKLLRVLLDRYKGPTLALHYLATMLVAIARHQLRLPPEDVAAMSELRRKVRVAKPGMTTTNRARLRPFTDERTMDRLVTLPQELMRTARRAGTPAEEAARTAMTAVAIELLLTLALRIGNLVSLELGRHVLLDPQQPDRVSIVIDEAETKNGSFYDVELPAESGRMIRLYIDRFLPVLAGPGTRYLFPASKGGPARPSTLGRRIMRTIRRELGLVVHPHLFRHLGARRHLDENPGDYETVRNLLRHKSLETTTGSYVDQETAAATRRFDAGLLARRRKAEQRLGRRRGR